jgi:hypothetical protein
VGHGAILHACTIEDGAFVGMVRQNSLASAVPMSKASRARCLDTPRRLDCCVFPQGATVMDGAVVQRGAMVAAGALVTRACAARIRRPCHGHGFGLC